MKNGRLCGKIGVSDIQRAVYALKLKEKEMDNNNNITLKVDNENIGCVQIADDVVAMIAALASSEVEGVSAMTGNITNELMSKVAMKKLTKGVRVALLDNVVTVNLSIVLEYGYNIPDTCKKVQEKVKNSVENMTGLTVEDVNIRIASVNMPKGK